MSLPPASLVTSKNTKRSNTEDEHIGVSETQHPQYHSANQLPHHLSDKAQQEPQNYISEREYLALIAEAQRGAEPESSSPHYNPVTPSERLAQQYYARNPGHPLASSSLEKEIEKLVSANGHHYYPQAGGQETHQAAPQTVAAQHEANTPSPQQFITPVPQHHQAQPHPQQQLRSPVVFKNHNNVVYIPYQHQQPQQHQPQPQVQDLQPVPYAHPGSGITRAKVLLINKYAGSRPPPPGEAIEYHAQPQTPPQYHQIRSQESFKELYLQQQRENQIKRLQQEQQHQQQLQQHLHQTPQPADNVNLQSHSQPLSINLLPKKHVLQTPTTQQFVAQQPSPSENIAQFAEQLFKTPLDQQKPLTQEQFKALVAAGYPVQAVHVQVPKGPRPVHYPPQIIQRYASSAASLAPPQPFSHPQKAPTSVVQIQYQQQQFAQPQQGHRVVAAAQQPINRFFGQKQPQIVQHHTAQQPQLRSVYPNPEQQPQQQQQHHHQQQVIPQNSPYTYVLRQGENEELATEQFRQQVIKEINEQQNGQKQAPSPQDPQLNSGGFTPSHPNHQVEYQRIPAQPAVQSNPHGHHTLATATQATTAAGKTQQLSDAQKDYYRRLEYY